MAKITLENMEFHAFHGCLEHEQKFGNTFVVSLDMELNTSRAGETDDLKDTLNYQLVYDLVKTEMAIPSKLLEHLSERIAGKLMENFSQPEKIRLKICKLNPPLGGKVGAVCIEIEKSKQR